jgi:hypothetical protein
MTARETGQLRQGMGGKTRQDAPGATARSWPGR